MFGIGNYYAHCQTLQAFISINFTHVIFFIIDNAQLLFIREVNNSVIRKTVSPKTYVLFLHVVAFLMF